MSMSMSTVYYIWYTGHRGPNFVASIEKLVHMVPTAKPTAIRGIEMY